MKRSPFTTRRRTEAESSRVPPAEGRRRSGRLRKAVAALGVLALAWLASRRLSGDGGLSTEDVRERASDAIQVDIGGPEDERSGEWAESTPRESPVGDIGGTERRADEESTVDETMSEDEIEERVESDVDEEPAPPGEMNVDDEVTEEVFEDEETSPEHDDDMLGQDETDMEGDEDQEE